MADTLKEFSSFTGKSYSDLKDGITIASTNGSQKAVIKQISIDNPNGRNIQIRKGSVTGPIVAQTTSDGFSGNEILDNSQSLVATTDEKCPITAIHQVGWYEGHTGALELNTGHIRVWGQRHRYRGYDWSYDDLDWGPTNEMGLTSGSDYAYTKRFFNSAATGQQLKAVSDSWWGADGRFYWVHRQGNGAIGSTGLSDFTVRRFETDSTTYTTYGANGDAYVSAYDGERYFYTIANAGTEMRRYDTTTLGTSNTYTAIPIREDDKDSGTLLIWFYNDSAGYYYNDGYILMNGTNTTTEKSGGDFRLISCATGKSRSCFGPAWDDNTTYGSGTAQSTHRPSIGLVRDSQGCYWTFIGRYANDSHNNDNNKIYVASIGNDPEKTFLGNGQSWGRKKIWMLRGNSTDKKHLQTPENSHAQNVVQKLGVNGSYFGNPAGTVVHSPGLDRYLMMVGSHYKDGQNCSSNDRGPYFQLFDFDNVLSRSGFLPDKFRGNQMRYANYSNSYERYAAGVYRMVNEPDAADGSFGDISIRTTGILIT